MRYWIVVNEDNMMVSTKHQIVDAHVSSIFSNEDRDKAELLSANLQQYFGRNYRVVPIEIKF